MADWTNSEIRAAMKTAGKSLKDIVQERNRLSGMYASLLANIKKRYGANVYYDLRRIAEAQGIKFADKEGLEFLNRNIILTSQNNGRQKHE